MQQSNSVGTPFKVKVEIRPIQCRVKNYMLGKTAYPTENQKNDLYKIAGEWLWVDLANVAEGFLVAYTNIDYKSSAGATGETIQLYFNELSEVKFRGVNVESMEQEAIALGQTYQYTQLCLAIESKKLIQLVA